MRCIVSAFWLHDVTRALPGLQRGKTKAALSEVLGAWEGILTPTDDNVVLSENPRKPSVSRHIRDMSSASIASYDTRRHSTATSSRTRTVATSESSESMATYTKPKKQLVTSSVDFGSKAPDTVLANRRSVLGGSSDYVAVPRRSASTTRTRIV